MHTVRFATELRDPRDYSNNLESVQADTVQLSLAKQLLDAYTQPFEVSNVKDHYEEALRELVEAKINNLPVAEPEAEKRPAKVIDLVAPQPCSGEPSASHSRERTVPSVAESKTGKAAKKTAGTSTGKASPAAGASAKKSRSA